MGMQDVLSGFTGLLFLTAFSLLGFALMAWRWWARSGGLSRGAFVGLALLTVALFLVLVPTFRVISPELAVAETVGMALWSAVFIVGSGVIIWLRYKALS